MSTLSLPPLKYFTNVVYFETTFPATYSITEGLARVQRVWIEGPEPECGVEIDASNVLDSKRLPEEDCFDYASYYGESGEPVVTTTEKSDWHVQSKELRSMVSCAALEALLRVESKTQTRWLNQR